MSFQKPSRYINCELNSIHKKAPVRVALAFPDVYEIGMSHLGLKVLYAIINSLPYASAERVFSPWIDLEEAMKTKKVFLSSLESGLPLKDFDIVGFSLQYELSYPTVLNMLHLGGIPLRTEERMDSNEGPIIIAGGPGTLNPFPMSPFIDAFFIGDAEDGSREIVDSYFKWKEGGSKDRTSLLKSLSAIEGVFVPSLGREKMVTRRIVPSLEDAPFPDKPVLPYMGIIHDRVNIEIARGCSMGCRFCQAGMAYRPVRERSPKKVLELAEKSLRNTGYEDVSFTSLSSGDYSCLPELMKEFNNRFSRKRISISLPSLRVASVTGEMLRQIRSVRKTGFTIAPEAGTDRLRAVINKNFTEEAYVTALETLFREGWHNLKLYYMTGLPTETEADVASIPEMVLKAIKISKKLTGKNVNINVGVSSFVPKPHTPFQWFGQNPLEVLKEKNSYLRKAFLRRGVKYKGHNEEMSLLEAVFARGDERVSQLIEAAWKEGCRLDAWTEVFDFEKWKRAMEVSGINGPDFSEKEYGIDAPFPWDNIKTGVTREYLVKEYHSALSGNFTSDCKKRCHGCGLKCRPEGEAGKISGSDVGNEVLQERSTATSYGSPQLPDNVIRARLQYAKTGRARYLSHLELTTAILRAMRRADYPLRYSAGFHPSPRVSFGPALGVGIAGMREYLDLELTPPFEIESSLKALGNTLPGGITAERLVVLYGREKSLTSFIVRYIYEVRCGAGLDERGFSDKEEILVERKDGLVNIRKMVEEIKRIDDNTFRLTLQELEGMKIRLNELLQTVFGVPSEELDITRTTMFGWNGSWVEPLEDEKIWAARS